MATAPVLLAQSTRCVASDGDAVITDQSECEAAATTLGKVWTQALSSNVHIYGCLIFRGDTENSVYFNSKADSTRTTWSLNRPICARAVCPAPSPPPFAPPAPIAPGPQGRQGGHGNRNRRQGYGGQHRFPPMSQVPWHEERDS